MSKCHIIQVRNNPMESTITNAFMIYLKGHLLHIHAFSIRAHLTWDASIPHSAPISAPISDRPAEWRADWSTYIHNTYIHACIHTYIVLPVLSARRYIHTFSIHAYLTWDTSMPHSAPISAPNSDRRAE